MRATFGLRLDGVGLINKHRESLDGDFGVGHSLHREQRVA